MGISSELYLCDIPEHHLGDKTVLPRPKEVFNKEAALECVDGDRELFREVVAIFSEEYPRTVLEIHDALGSGDAAGLSRSTHKLRGLVSNFGARSAGQLALSLEIMGDAGALAGAGAAFAMLKNEVDRLGHELNELIGGGKQ